MVSTKTQPAAASSQDVSPPRLADWSLVLITAAVTLPLVWWGYGTDIDAGNLLDAGARIRSWDYAPSRNPGVPVVEAIVAVLGPLGPVAVNLATAAALAAAVVGCARLVRAWGHENGDVVALAFLASPITLIAGTSTGDFVWALALFVWGALAHLRDRTVVAGVLFALAIGSRPSTAAFIVAFLVADGWDRGARRRCLVTAAVTVPVVVLLFVPAWLSFDRSFGFLEHTQGWQGLANNVGRFLVKDYGVAGLAMIVVVALAVPALIGSLRRWGSDPLVRFGVLGLVAAQLTFLLFPWKPTHLLPSLLGLVLWIAATDRSRRYLWLLVAAVALNGLVTLRIFAPDQPDASRSARFEPALSWGLLVNDVRCRLDFMDEPPDAESGAWSCTLEPLRGEGDADHDVLPPS
jgi:cytochrome c oxidase subunit IV